MKYIQSFYQYPVTFSAIGKTIPARSAQGEMKNIAEVTEKELEKLQNSEPFFRELVSKKKVRVLNHIPTSYVPPAQRINEATAEADKFKTENEKLRARIAELEAKAGKDADNPVEAAVTDSDREKLYKEMTYAELQNACMHAGIEYKNKKKAELIEALEAFTNQ